MYNNSYSIYLPIHLNLRRGLQMVFRYTKAEGGKSKIKIKAKKIKIKENESKEKLVMRICTVRTRVLV